MSMKLKIPPPIIGLACALVIYLLNRQLDQFEFDFPYRNVLALCILFLALAIDVLALLEFRKLKTTINPMNPDNTSSLVDSGIYRYSRNPMYLGLLCMLIAWCLYLGNFAGFVILPVFIWYITVFQIIPEEFTLQENFKEEFTQYKQCVRRWI